LLIVDDCILSLIMSPGGYSGLCLFMALLSMYSFTATLGYTFPYAYAYAAPAQPPYFPPAKPANPFGPVRRAILDEQEQITQLITGLLNLPNIESCEAPATKSPYNIKLTIDDIIKRLSDIPNKLKCEQPVNKTPKSTKKVSQCRKLKNGDVFCIEAVEEDDITQIKVTKNDKIITQTKMPQTLTKVLEPVLDKIIPPTEPVIKKVTKTRRVLPNGDVIDIEVIEEDDMYVIITKRNDEPINKKRKKGPTGNPLSIIEDEVSINIRPEIPPNDTTVAPQRPKGTQKCYSVNAEDIICIKLIPNDDKVTVIVEKNGKVIVTEEEIGDIPDVLNKVIKKYIPTGPATNTKVTTGKPPVKKSTKCVIINEDDRICVEVIEEEDTITVITRRNDKVIDTKEEVGDVTEIINKTIRKFTPKDPKPQEKSPVTPKLPAKLPNEKPFSKKTTKCVILNNEENICVEVIEEDEIITVITKKNDKVIDTKEETGDISDILNKTIKKYVPLTPNGKLPTDKPVTKKTTRCIILNNKQTICVEVIEFDDKITVITKRNDEVIDTREETGDVPDILSRIVKKYIPSGTSEKPNVTSKKPRRSSKCVTLLNGDTVCVETIEYADKTIVKTLKNNEIVDESESTEDITEIIETTLKKYTTSPKGKKTPVKKSRKCRMLENGETVCIEVSVEDEIVIVTTIKNDVVVNKKKVKGNPEDVLEKEFDEYVTTSTTVITREQVVGRTKSKCRILSTGEKYCVEITEQDGKLTVIVKKNNVIINTRVTKGDLEEVLEEELNQFGGKLPSSQTNKGKSVTKCGGIENGDQYCVEVIDEDNSYKVIVKKNNVLVSSRTRDATQPLATVLNEEFGKYMTLISTDSSSTRTNKKCRTYGNGDKVCVEVAESDGVKTVKTFKNGNVVRTRKSQDDLKDIYEKEFDDFKS
jgi:hypothetical protein